MYTLFFQLIEHGFPSKPSALAFDPKLKLLALGTKSGAIRMYPLLSIIVSFIFGQFAQTTPVYRLAMSVCLSTFSLKFLVEAKSWQWRGEQTLLETSPECSIISSIDFYGNFELDLVRFVNFQGQITTIRPNLTIFSSFLSLQCFHVR